MENKNLFNNPSDEILKTFDELQEIKGILRSLLSRANNIEKRLTAISPKLKDRQDSKAISQQVKKEVEELKNFYQELIPLFNNEGLSSVEKKLKELSKENLLTLGKELGCPSSQKDSTNKLIDMIAKRVKESSMLNQSLVKSKI